MPSTTSVWPGPARCAWASSWRSTSPAATTDRAALETKLHALCRDLLSNPVIEDYRLELGE